MAHLKKKFKNFWTDTTFEPKQDFKWYVIVELGGNDYIPPFYAKSVAKPSFSVNMKTYKLINRQIKQPTNLTWDPINITFIDTARSRIASFLKSYLENTEYNNINQNILTNTTTSKTGSNKHITKVFIVQIDSEGKFVERWVLQNPQISKFQASELSYESDALSTYTFTIDYDWAQLEVPKLENSGGSFSSTDSNETTDNAVDDSLWKQATDFLNSYFD